MAEDAEDGIIIEEDGQEVVDDSFAMPDDKIIQYSKNIHTAKAEMQEHQGTHGQLFKQFEEDGGDKWALKLAHQFQKMESVQAQSRLRNFYRYMEILGVFDQHDLFDATPVIGVPEQAPEEATIN